MKLQVKSNLRIIKLCFIYDSGNLLSNGNSFQFYVLRHLVTLDDIGNNYSVHVLPDIWLLTYFSMKKSQQHNVRFFDTLSL